MSNNCPGCGREMKSIEGRYVCAFCNASCEHGHQQRKCRICELEAEVNAAIDAYEIVVVDRDEAREKLAKAVEALRRFSRMPHDELCRLGYGDGECDCIVHEAVQALSEINGGEARTRPVGAVGEHDLNPIEEREEE